MRVSAVRDFSSATIIGNEAAHVFALYSTCTQVCDLTSLGADTHSKVGWIVVNLKLDDVDVDGMIRLTR